MQNLNIQEYPYLIVGAGFYGATMAERIASVLNQKVLVLDKRNHIGGNSYSETCSETGIEYHKYGAHIFHTSNQKVWDYVRQFGEFNHYYHQVLTTYQNKVYQMPINLETINSFYGTNLKPYEVGAFMEAELQKEQYDTPQNLEEQAINLIGRPLYEAFIKGYTEKHWGKKATELPAAIIKRLPFRENYAESYFFDKYQGIPEGGYAKLFENMLSHPNISLQLNTDFLELKSQLDLSNTKLIYTGPIDRYFDYVEGELEWISLKFRHRVEPVNDWQGTSVMNYAESSVPYTRIHEPKHFHPERKHYFSMEQSLCIEEYPVHQAGTEPYYPVNNEHNNRIYQAYRTRMKAEQNVLFGGRLGDYKYYDMHHVIQNALNTFENYIRK